MASDTIQSSDGFNDKVEYVAHEHVPTINTNGSSLDADAIVRKQIEAVDAGLDVQLKSEFDRLSILQALWTFRKTVMICGLAGFCAATDGQYLLQ
jgi:hypothetical protein